MSTRVAPRTMLRLVIVGASLLSVGCAGNPTAPVVTRSIQATTIAAHDDDPPMPDEACDSGWTLVTGRWECDK